MTTGDTPPPPVACPLHSTGVCPSCPHLDTAPSRQIADKQARVAALLSRHLPTSAWLEPVAGPPQRFRNKAKMAVSGTAAHPVLGILGPDGHGTDLRSCPLHVRQIKTALPILADLISALRLTPYDVAARRGELKYILVTTSPDGELMVRWVLRTTRHVAALREALPHLSRLLPGLAVVSVNLQPRHAAVIEGEREIMLSRRSDLPMRLTLPAMGPDGTIDDSEPGLVLPLHLPPRSFFQTNTSVAEALYAQARAWAGDGAVDDGPTGRASAGEPQVAWDLFCGVGGFALALASQSRRVFGIEVAPSAVDGARRAATEMGLEPGLVGFEAGDATVLDPSTRGPGGERCPDLLVINPPRRGIGADLAARIESSGVKRVLYSSCNPASLAHDLEAMPSLHAVRARLFDMFPHTDHAEVLVDLRDA